MSKRKHEEGDENVECDETDEEEDEEIEGDDDDDDDDDDETGDDDEDDDDNGTEGSSKSSTEKRQVYLPGQPLDANEELVCDSSAYVLYHRIQTGAPCLSFDILRDDLGEKREEFPMTCYLVAGTQSDKSKSNEVIVLKLTNMNRVKKKSKDDESDSDSSSDEDSDGSKFESASIRHEGSVNRIRSTIINQRHMAATWSENKKVYIWDLTSSLCTVNNSLTASNNKYVQQSPVFTFSGHQDEGFAMDWSPLESGTLATGDCLRNIHVWQLDKGSNKWSVDSTALSGHSGSVEDLQWSPTERNWLASCSVDKSIRIWDVRCGPQNACKITIAPAHSSDVNVISWNKLEARYIASGGDDGLIKVWDLRQCRLDKPLTTLPIVAKFKHHSGPITSVEWSPHDSSVLAACGEDNQLTQWDIAVEKSDMAEDEPDVLPQLLFIHQGQDDIKELHWHPQLPGVIISTALSDFNVFKTISV